MTDTTSIVAFTAVIAKDGDNERGHFSVGAAELNVPGYTPLKEPPYFKTWDEASAEARRRNEHYGIDEATATKIVLSSMGAQHRAGR